MIILASKSPRRKQLLEQAEIPFEIITLDTDENFPDNLSIEEVPVFIAQQKAKAVAALHSGETILAADTIVTIGNAIIGKPKDRTDAIHILQQLSGKTHRVITGVAIISENGEESFYDITEVEFHLLRNEQIEFYVDKYQPYDKAGAYAIQEWIGVVGIKKINGDFYNVMGLPVSRVVRVLQKL
ncbi:septum formation protein Maf [Arachidicoccus ginsenosidimutans]|uniref:Maf family nucleotide pyrophosphatase n=1 Tax=Arachidicoccus sp. BS20 TaxID=1850526 RepID=UPI0007F16D4B|nr:Maf family protein [Arachidicoccus sp. BS20]ANI88355.1 septum formation protein Maf [Arachidicoccus sp. BS20]